MSDAKDKPLPAPRLETFEEVAKRYPELDPAAMHAYVVLRRAETRLTLALETQLGRHGLSLGRYLVLMNLIRADGHSLAPAQLAGLCGNTRATITGLVDTLEKSGYVVREEDPADGRSVQVRLTLTGRRFLEGMLPDHFRRLMKLMSAFTPDELTAIERLGEKLLAGVSALEEP
jgi:DNA-binding MarR family transcriptional regulator